MKNIGIYTTDGDFIDGTLQGYRDLARRLAESQVGLYLETVDRTLVMGSAINVQIAGRRPDTVLVVARSSPDFLQLQTGNTLRQFFETSLRALDERGYRILNVGSDERMLPSLDPERAPERPAADEAIASFSAGMLIAGRTVRVTSRDLGRAVVQIAATADLLRPVLSLGFTMGAARRTFDADLTITPEKPPEAGTIEADLDTGRIGDPGEARIFAGFTTRLQDPAIRQAASRHDLAEMVAGTRAATGKTRGSHDRPLTPASGKNGYAQTDIRQAIAAVTGPGNTEPLDRTLREPSFSREALREGIMALSAEEFRLFWERIAYSKMSQSAAGTLWPIFSRYRQDLENIGEALDEKAGRKKGGGSIPKKRGEKRGWPFWILILLIAIAAIAISALFGGIPVPDIPSSPAAETPEPETTPATVESADLRARLALATPAGTNPALVTVPVPQDFSHPDDWRPVSPFYRIEPDAITFDPPAKLTIVPDWPDTAGGELFVARRSVSNNTLTGPWMQLNTTVVGNESVSVSVTESGLYGAFFRPVTTG